MPNLNGIESYDYNQYNKITDEVYFIGRNLSLKFNVALSRRNEDRRDPFHSEFAYSSRGESLVTIKRSFDYYLSLENIMSLNYVPKEYIMITPSDFIRFRNMLEEVVSWFISEKYSRLYAKDDSGELIMTSQLGKASLQNLPLGKFIVIEATIIEYANKSVPGARIYMSADNNFTDVSVDRLLGLFYVVSSFNMYLAAQNMLNYIGRPPSGYNMVSFNNKPDEAPTNAKNNFTKEKGPIIGRTVPSIEGE